jgi:hypothetical protein
VASFAPITRTFQFIANAVRGLARGNSSCQFSASAPLALAALRAGELCLGRPDAIEFDLFLEKDRRCPRRRPALAFFFSSPFSVWERVVAATIRLQFSAIAFYRRYSSALAAQVLDTHSDGFEIVGSARSGHVFSSGVDQASAPETANVKIAPKGRPRQVCRPIALPKRNEPDGGISARPLVRDQTCRQQSKPAREYFTGTCGRASETADVPRTTEQPHDQDDDKDHSEYPADAVTAAAAVVAAAIISEAATKKDDQQNNYEYQFHDKAPSSQQFRRFRLA